MEIDVRLCRTENNHGDTEARRYERERIENSYILYF